MILQRIKLVCIDIQKQLQRRLYIVVDTLTSRTFIKKLAAMDHIQKIVEQIKSEQARSNNDRPEKYVLSKKKEAIHDSKQHLEHADSLLDIKYDQTKKIEIDPDKLIENKLIACIKSDPRSTSFRMLRTQVLQKLRENNWNTLAISGATKGAGKSFVAANLAVSIALELNQTVLLVDMDLRRPNTHTYFGFVPEDGLLDYIQNDVPIKDIMINPGIDRLVILPSHGTTEDASEIISSPKMLRLIDELKNRYRSRVVLFDLPPLLSVDDAWVFLPHVDASLLVVENGKNTEDEVNKSLKILERTNFIGAVLNKADEDNSDRYSY